MTFRAFQQRVCAKVAALADSFTAPDEDWATVAMLADSDDKITMLALPGDPAQQTAMILSVVGEVHARKAAVVISTWARAHPQAIRTRAGRAAAEAILGRAATSQAEQARIEAVLVMVLDEERIEAWLAPILRDGTHPPKLGSWRPSGQPAGPRLEQIKQALR